MLHELLLALSGHPGSIFIQDNQGNVRVVGPLPFLHSAEEALLNRLCRLATHYTRFQNFINKHTHVPFTGNSSGLHGLYVRAFCQGLDSVLQPYRLTLLRLEKELLADSHLTAAHLQPALEQYQLLFPALSSVLDQITEQKAHGCQLLDVLHRAAACGMTTVHTALLQVLHLCHGVLYKQLASWMLHGMLLDTYGEFFVQRRQVGTSQPTTAPPEEDDLGLSGITAKHIQRVVALTEAGRHSSGDLQFCLHPEMLPCYIPSRVAQKVLFVGESVAMFEHNREGLRHRHGGSILKAKSDEFAQELLQLSRQPEFNLMAFETCIDRIRTYVAEQLWVLVVEQSGLMTQLRAIKDFYLLGRGELFLTFIDNAHGLLQGLPTVSTQHDAEVKFHQSARNVLLQDESLLHKFSLTVPIPEPNKEGSPRKGGDGSVDTGWSTLGMKCSVDWPLHILFTPGVLERYNTLFKFLLFVRRSQVVLQQCWAQQMSGQHTSRSHALSGKWWLRTHMAFLVDNLQYYLQVDVIDSQFSILQDKIEKTRDFEEIRLAHEHFLTALLDQSFLLKKPVAKCLKDLLELCHVFCSILNQGDEAASQRNDKIMESLTKDFHRRTELLFDLLSSVRSHQSSPHLAQFMLRVDYNKFFSTSRGKLSSGFEGIQKETPAISSRRY